MMNSATSLPLPFPGLVQEAQRRIDELFFAAASDSALLKSAKSDLLQGSIELLTDLTNPTSIRFWISALAQRLGCQVDPFNPPSLSEYPYSYGPRGYWLSVPGKGNFRVFIHDDPNLNPDVRNAVRVPGVANIETSPTQMAEVLRLTLMRVYGVPL